MKKTYTSLFLALFTLAAFGKDGSKHKSTFSEKDVFQTAFFIKNAPGLISDCQGQPIRYFADHDGVRVFLTDQGLAYKLTQKDEKKIKELEKENAQEHKEGRTETEREEMSTPLREGTTLVKWIGANPHPRIEGSAKGSAYYSFLAGKTDAELHSIVADGFGKVTYHDLYPGIDVEYTFPEKGGMKYNFIVHPGADMSRIQMEYSGAAKTISKNNNGDITIHTLTGDIVEHAPVSYTADGNTVLSSYQVRGTKVRFSLPAGYDHSQTLIIDPWVTVLTVLTVRNLGTSVDYDLAGNLYVYGAGSSDYLDIVNFHKVAKFDVSGNSQWVFMGSVPAASWNTTSTGNGWDFLSNAKVDRVANKVYVGKGYDGSGTQMVRITSAGLYDNFISTPNPLFQETWSVISDCSLGTILALGGGTNSPLNMGVVNPLTGAVSINNITNNSSAAGQDIASGTYDAFGSLYVILACAGTASLNNYIFKVNSTYNGNVWTVPSGFNSFAELYNVPAFGAANFNGNNFNGLAANGNYLYYYDGVNLQAFNLTNGNVVGTPTSIPSYTILWQGGIAVDNCDHIYLGGQGVIKTFSFNGSTFTASADIPLGAAFAGDTVNDIRYNSSNNLLYVAGSQIVGTYTATLSGSCTVVNTLTASVAPSCGKAIVTVTPGAGLTNAVFSYLWSDSLGNILRQTAPGTALIDTLTGLNAGKYTVQVQLNVNCGGSTVIDTFNIICNNLIHSPDTTICAGQSVTLSATGNPAGGIYRWMPGGATGSSVTVSPAVSTTYAVTYTPPTGAAITDSIHVTVNNSTTVSVNNATICPGQNATLTATPAVGGGTYSWSPGGATTQSITVSPATTSTYTVTYTSGSCGVAIDSGIVTLSSTPSLSVTNATICPGQSATLTATPSVAGGTYSWSPGGATTQSITVSPATTTTYTVTYTSGSCGVAIDSSIVTISSTPSLSVTNATVCPGQSATITATPSFTGGTYSWSPGGAITQSITVSPAITTTYTVTYSTATCGAVVDSGTVTVTSLPTVTVNDTSICIGQSGILTASPSVGGGTYSWSPGGATTQSIAVSPATNTTYTVSYTISGCTPVSASGTVSLTSGPADTVLTKPADCTSADGVAISQVSGGMQPYSYLWSDAAHSTGDTLSGLLANTTYTVTVTDQNHCTVSASGLIGLTGASLSINLDSMISITCPGLQNGAIYVHVPNCSSCTYQWSNNTGSNSVTGLAPGTYDLTVTGPSGCTNTTSFTVNEPPQATLSISPADANIAEDSTLMLNTAFGPYPSSAITSYNWTPTTGLSCSNCPQPVFSSGPGMYQYTLIVDYNKGCVISDTVNILVYSRHLIYVPNSFTPNGDGTNDVFYVFPISVKYFKLSVFDRWGEKVFESQNENIGWDGTYKGTREPVGVYVYVLDATFHDGYTVHNKGSITLIR